MLVLDPFYLECLMKGELGEEASRSLTKLCVFPSGESSENPSGVSLPLTSWYFMPLMEHSRNCISFSVNVPVLSVNTYSTFYKIKKKNRRAVAYTCCCCLIM